MRHEPGAFHTLQEPEHRRVRQLPAPRQPLADLTNGHRPVFPQEPEHFELTFSDRQSFATGHRGSSTYVFISTDYCVARRSCQEPIGLDPNAITCSAASRAFPWLRRRL